MNDFSIRENMRFPFEIGYILYRSVKTIDPTFLKCRWMWSIFPFFKPIVCFLLISGSSSFVHRLRISVGGKRLIYDFCTNNAVSINKKLYLTCKTMYKWRDSALLSHRIHLNFHDCIIWQFASDADDRKRSAIHQRARLVFEASKKAKNKASWGQCHDTKWWH